MQNSELVMKIDATIMATASSPIQGSHGVGEKALCLSPQLEIKSGGDDAVVAPKGDEEVDQKPTLVGIDHKRKASTEIDPFCESDPDSCHGSKHLNSPPVSTPIVEQEQQVDEEMLPLEVGDDNEKMEEDKGVSDGGPLEMDSDQNKGEGLIMNSPNNVEEEKVETEAIESMNVEPEGNKGKNKEGTVNSPSNVVVEEEKVETNATESMNVEPKGDKGTPHGGEGIVNSPSDVEKEKVETDHAAMNVEHDGDKGTSHGRHFELDLNRRVEEIVNSPSYVETETTKVETEAIESVDVKPQGNNGMPRVVRLLGIDLNLEADHQGMMQHSSNDVERETTRVQPEIGHKGMPHECHSLLDLNKGKQMVEHDSVDQNIEVEPYVAENIEVNCAIEKMVQMGVELLCDLNEEADPFSDENEIEAEPAANAGLKKKTEVESCGADKVEVEQCAEENNEEEDDDGVEMEKREVVLALPAVIENDEVETSPPRDYVIDLNKTPPGYNDEN
ncbi:hypothetical protein glysoja_003088 [Glycine soja]|nr:hypothetical protein glysoja_003088 [Glycine soja]